VEELEEFDRRRTRASASAKVGRGLVYQAVCGSGSGAVEPAGWVSSYVIREVKHATTSLQEVASVYPTMLPSSRWGTVELRGQ
jgi:hypothetical protein